MSKYLFLFAFKIASLSLFSLFFACVLSLCNKKNDWVD